MEACLPNKTFARQNRATRFVRDKIVELEVACCLMTFAKAAKCYERVESAFHENEMELIRSGSAPKRLPPPGMIMLQVKVE